MSVNLQKGQKVDLRKSDGNALRFVMVGLGWDEAERKRGFFAPKPQTIDCDATVFLLTDGKLRDSSDIVYYNNLAHKSGAVRHMGDNLTGAGEGDDEQILVELNKLPETYDRLVFVVNIYRAAEKKQHFGMIRNAFIRVCDGDNNQELCRYNLSENYDGMTAMVCGEVYRRNGSWKFNAIGQATTDGSISALAKRYQ
ncbi:MAG: TerD family protein [Clostridia bacterium]|nr:TerD family protein [Clostridia bacterium]